MSKTTREINKITTAVISISIKLIVYALVILLLYEAVTQGFAFGHEIFYAEAAEDEPGRDVTVTISPEDSLRDTAAMLAEYGLITNEFAFVFQGMFYDYSEIYPGTYTLNTSMTSKEILQILNEKPEEETEQEMSEGEAASEEDVQAAARTAETSGAEESGRDAESRDAAGDTVQSQDAAAAAFTAPAEDAATSANDQIYEGEEIEEGGWIEDVGGEEVP